MDPKDGLPPQRPGADTPEPPPVPASHPAGKNRIREALRIPIAFYVEALGTGLVLFGLYVGVHAISPIYAPILLLFGGVVAFLACVVRMVKRVLAARARGRPPIEATLVFWATVVLPVAGAGWYARREIRNYDPRREKQVEARLLLARAVGAEKAFYQNYGRYTYDIKELGLEPEPGARYALGFPAACTAKYSVEGAKPTWDLLDFSSKLRRFEMEEFFKRVRLPDDCVQPGEGFEVYAVAVLRDDEPLDVWGVDRNRKLVHPEREK